MKNVDGAREFGGKCPGLREGVESCRRHEEIFARWGCKGGLLRELSSIGRKRRGTDSGEKLTGVGKSKNRRLIFPYVPYGCQSSAPFYEPRSKEFPGGLYGGLIYLHLCSIVICARKELRI